MQAVANFIFEKVIFYVFENLQMKRGDAKSKSQHNEFTSIGHNLGQSPEYFSHFLVTFTLKLCKRIGLLGRFLSPLAISTLEFKF